MGHDYRLILKRSIIMKNTKAVIRNAAAYNSMLAEIKAVTATEGVTNYLIIEDRNATLYGGTMCYDHSSSGAYVGGTKVVRFCFENTIGTISSEGNYCDEEIHHISVDFMLRKIKSALKEAFSAPEFVSNNGDCPADDDGMWWNNHRLVPSTVTVEVNDHKWSVNFQD